MWAPRFHRSTEREREGVPVNNLFRFGLNLCYVFSLGVAEYAAILQE
jgi:hypothetical protein